MLVILFYKEFLPRSLWSTVVGFCPGLTIHGKPHFPCVLELRTVVYQDYKKGN